MAPYGEQSKFPPVPESSPDIGPVTAFYRAPAQGVLYLVWMMRIVCLAATAFFIWMSVKGEGGMTSFIFVFGLATGIIWVWTARGLSQRVWIGERGFCYSKASASHSWLFTEISDIQMKTVVYNGMNRSSRGAIRLSSGRTIVLNMMIQDVADCLNTIDLRWKLPLEANPPDAR